MRRYRDYDPFAWLYTNYWGNEFHRQIMPVLDRLILKDLPKRSKVLDLCCGDGRVSQQLGRRGYQVTGVDGSEQMLAYAKQRSPKGEFLLLDARSFHFRPEFDAAVSTFDSLNHVMDEDGLAAVFVNVFNCLKPGGAFVFDLNREEAYTDFWARTSHFVNPTAVSIARGSYQADDRVAHCDVTLFRLEGDRWERSDFRLTQCFHPQEQVVRQLEAAGFTASVLDGQGDLEMRGDIGVGRSFYLARKPGDREHFSAQ